MTKPVHVRVTKPVRAPLHTRDVRARTNSNAYVCALQSASCVLGVNASCGRQVTVIVLVACKLLLLHTIVKSCIDTVCA